MSKESLIGNSLKNFTIVNKLGSGSYAVVYEAIDRKTSQRVAIKAIPIKLIKQRPKLKQLVETQIKVLQACKNQNVIRHIISFKSDTNIYIVIQLCNGGDVQMYLDKKGRLTEQQATNYLKQILNGFKGLHQVNAMHRDFKLANLLLHNKCIKIADLGFAKQLEKQQSLTDTQLGSGPTMAPEVLTGQKYGMIADIWSIGVVYYQMLFGVYPYKGEGCDMQILKQIKNITQLKFPVNISADAKDFIKKCLTIEPSKRISWIQIYEHPLITKQNNLVNSNTSISKIKLEQNKQYYQKNELKPQQKFVYPQKQSFITNGYEINQIQQHQFQQKQDKQKSSFQKIKIQNEQNKKKQKEIFDYEELLIKKRNNIMFMFQYYIPKITPFIKSISMHHIAMFFICKKALIQIESLLNQLNQKCKGKNDSSNLFLKAFFQSKRYQKIVNILTIDIEDLRSQLYKYMQQINISGPQIQCQLDDLTRWNGQTWQVVLSQVIGQYWYQIAQNIDTSQQQQQKNLIQILKALQFFRTTDQVNVEVFQKILETLDYQQEKQQIDRKLFEIFK